MISGLLRLYERQSLRESIFPLGEMYELIEAAVSKTLLTYKADRAFIPLDEQLALSLVKRAIRKVIYENSKQK